MKCSRLRGGLLVVMVAVCLAMIPAAQAGQLDKVYASDGVVDMNFGCVTGISGNTMVVGATDTTTGAAYVYTKDGTGDWGTEVKLNLADWTDIGDFGNGAAIDGNTIIIGANKSTVGGVASAGTAHIYDSDGMGGWTEVALLTAGADAISDISFGTSVAISGDIAIVGASKYDDAASDQGAVYVFGRDVGGTNQWGQITRLTASDPTTSAYFGAGVALDGNTALVGAYGASNAYIFEESIGLWEEKIELSSTAGTRFGVSVSLDGDTAVVGAYYADPDSTSNAGEAHILSRDQGGADTWGEVTDLVAPTLEANAYFGRSVAVDGSTIVVGAYGEDAGGLANSGAAYVFQDDGTYLGQLLPDDAAESNSFGRMVAISGDTIVATATKGDGVVADTGAAYFFPIPDMPPIIPGDADGDGYVDEDDAVILAENWGATNASWDMGDFNDDKTVNAADAAIMAANWNPAPPPALPAESTAVPEPSATLMLLATLCGWVLWRCR